MIKISIPIPLDTPSNLIMSAQPLRLKVTMLSDTVCPFCLLGKSKLSRALATFSSQLKVPLEISLHLKPFQLNPQASVDPVDKLQYYRAKFGAARMQQMLPNMIGMGKPYGINFDYGGTIGNTIRSHALIELAQRSASEVVKKAPLTPSTDSEIEKLLTPESLFISRLQGILYSYYFEKNGDITDRAKLASLGYNAGLSALYTEQEIIAKLSDPELEKDVSFKVAHCSDREKYEVSGVPFFVFSSENSSVQPFSVSGAQEPETFLAVLKRFA